MGGWGRALFYDPHMSTENAAALSVRRAALCLCPRWHIDLTRTRS